MFTAQDSSATLPIRQVECIRTQILEISKYEYKYYNKWRFIKDQVITHLYLGMYCIGSLFPKIIVGDTSFFIDNSTENFLKDEVFEGTWVYPQKWEVNLKTEYLNNPEYFRPQLSIWPTSYYNKAYFGMISGPISVSKGEIFEVNFSANYRRIELTAAISSDTIKTIINIDSIETLTSLVGPINKEDTVITVTTFSVYIDSIFTVSDSLADGEFYNSDTTFKFNVIYNDTTNLKLDTLKYRPSITITMSSDTVKTIIKADSIETSTSLVGPINKEDTVIVVTTFSVYIDSVFTVSDSLSDGKFYNYDTTFKYNIIYNDTTNLNIDTLKYEEGTVSLIQTNVYREINATEFFITLNPVNSDVDGVNLIIPSELTGNWEITLFDTLGNLLDRSSFITVGGTAYRWNLYSNNDRKLPRGNYILFGKFTDNSGRLQMFKRFIGVR